MRASFVLLALGLGSAGCTHMQLQRSTLKQTSTITDIRHQQVMDNLARIANHPASLPYFAVIDEGTTQVQDQGNPTGGIGFDPTGFAQASLGLSGSRTIADQWSQDPIKDPDRLKAMQYSYRWAMGDPGVAVPEVAETLKYFKVEDDLRKIPPGWFRVGCKKDVPKDACYVGRCGETYVWVTPDGRDGLTRFTFLIMDIATVDKESLTDRPKTQQVQVLKYNDKGQLERTETYTEEMKGGTPLMTPSVFQPRARVPDRGTGGGLKFTPGAPASPLRIR